MKVFPGSITQKFRWAHRVTVLSYFTLLAIMFYGCWFFGPSEVLPKLVLWLLISSGLLLILKGLVMGKKRSYIWYCYILLMYFIFCVQFLFSGGSVSEDTITEVVQSSAAWHEVVAMTAILIGFTTAILASRWVGGAEQAKQ